MSADNDTTEDTIAIEIIVEKKLIQMRKEYNQAEERYYHQTIKRWEDLIKEINEDDTNSIAYEQFPFY